MSDKKEGESRSGVQGSLNDTQETKRGTAASRASSTDVGYVSTTTPTTTPNGKSDGAGPAEESSSDAIFPREHLRSTSSNQTVRAARRAGKRGSTVDDEGSDTDAEGSVSIQMSEETGGVTVVYLDHNSIKERGLLDGPYQRENAASSQCTHQSHVPIDTDEEIKNYLNFDSNFYNGNQTVYINHPPNEDAAADYVLIKRQHVYAAFLIISNALFPKYSPLVRKIAYGLLGLQAFGLIPGAMQAKNIGERVFELWGPDSPHWIRFGEAVAVTDNAMPNFAIQIAATKASVMRGITVKENIERQGWSKMWPTLGLLTIALGVAFNGAISVFQQSKDTEMPGLLMPTVYISAVNSLFLLVWSVLSVLGLVMSELDLSEGRQRAISINQHLLEKAEAASPAEIAGYSESRRQAHANGHEFWWGPHLSSGLLALSLWMAKEYAWITCKDSAEKAFPEADED